MSEIFEPTAEFSTKKVSVSGVRAKERLLAQERGDGYRAAMTWSLFLNLNLNRDRPRTRPRPRPLLLPGGASYNKLALIECAPVRSGAAP